MKLRVAIWIMLMFASGVAHATGNEFNARCSYSHTWSDDTIVYPGKPGEAMVHEFFGNSSTDAYSTYESLHRNKVTTCDSNADDSAYWAPQLKRASGVTTPMYEKTYYKNYQPVVPVYAIRLGLEMLAGDHMGTAPNPHINFLCSGGSYTTTMPAKCPATCPGASSQLDISVHFPDCWDGQTLKPFGNGVANPMHLLGKAAKGELNVAYRNSDGTCPSAYPVKISELQMSVAYDLGTNPDLRDAQLSLDPVFETLWVLHNVGAHMMSR
jgi:hypothetical protein